MNHSVQGSDRITVLQGARAESEHGSATEVMAGRSRWQQTSRAAGRLDSHYCACILATLLGRPAFEPDT